MLLDIKVQTLSTLSLSAVNLGHDSQPFAARHVPPQPPCASCVQHRVDVSLPRLALPAVEVDADKVNVVIFRNALKLYHPIVAGAISSGLKVYNHIRNPRFLLWK